jgi:hypothetical protein
VEAFWGVNVRGAQTRRVCRRLNSGGGGRALLAACQTPRSKTPRVQGACRKPKAQRAALPRAVDEKHRRRCAPPRAASVRPPREPPTAPLALCTHASRCKRPLVASHLVWRAQKGGGRERRGGERAFKTRRRREASQVMLRRSGARGTQRVEHSKRCNTKFLFSVAQAYKRVQFAPRRGQILSRESPWCGRPSLCGNSAERRQRGQIQV